MRRLIPLLSLCLLAVGCGHIAIHQKADLSDKPTGIKFYAPKPYILVTRNGAKEAPVAVQQIYLPDLANPYYARTVAGLGSSKLTMAFSNGVLTNIGQETDPQINGLISTLAGVPGSLASAAKTREETRLLRQASGEELAQAAEALTSAADKIAQQLRLPVAANATTAYQRGQLGRIETALRRHADSLLAPGSAADVGTIAKAVAQTRAQLKSLGDGAAGKPASLEAFWVQIAAAGADVDRALALITPKDAPPPTFTLYEVIMDASGTRLREVPFPAAAP